MKLPNHRISVPTFLKVGKSTLSYLGEILQENELKQVVVFFGNGLINLFGTTVFNSLKAHQIELLHYEELDSTHIEDITKLAFSLPGKTEAIIAIGGGKVIDAAKYASFLKRLPFISIPTSSSSDGFSSSSASLLVEGRRTSVPAKLAYGIVVDLDVIKSAPEKFIYSGIGDLISKITALYDWIYEYEYGVGQLDDFALMIAKKPLTASSVPPLNLLKMIFS
nr:iron-containing alcohol dehydrogenase [Cellulosilyticum ruminicola]